MPDIPGGAASTNTPAAPTNNTPGFSAFGNAGSPCDFYNNYSNAVGRPHSYLPSTDPANRTWSRHMLVTSPLVMIRAGHVSFAANTDDLQTLIGNAIGITDPNQVSAMFSTDGAAQGTPFDLANRYGVDPKDAQALASAINQKKYGAPQDFTVANAPALRYFDFKPALDDYQAVVATLSARIYARMTQLTQLPWLSFDSGNGYTGQAYGGFVTFWADNASSVSESATTEVGQTAVAGIVKGLAETAKQAQFALGSSKFDGAAKVVSGAVDAIGGFVSSGPSGIAATLGDAVLGINPLFPEVWKDSAFTRTYDLSFKFHSPYGTPNAIYQNVLLPFSQLLALVLPVMRSPGAYSDPFVFQIDCPGHFSCDLGICTDFTFVKGGSDHLWTRDGLPRQIDVTMRVKDLYPTLMASHNMKSLYCNVGMGTFLDNLSGINLYTSSQLTGPLTLLHTSIQRQLTMGLTLPRRLQQDLTNLIHQRGSVANLWR